jgi:hypothetical protein
MKYLMCIILFASFTCKGGISVVNGLSHEHQNAQLTGSIKVKNEGTKTERVSLYLQDLVPNCDGSVVYQEPSGQQWIFLDKDFIELGAGEEVEVKYSLVPFKERETSQWQVVMVEAEDPIATDHQGGVQINSKVRYAIQIVLHAGAYQAPEVGFHEVKLNSKETISVTLKNHGSYMTFVNLKLEVLTEEGKIVKVFEGNNRRIFPGYCTTFTIPVDDIPAGKYAGVLVADNGKDLYGSHLLLEL